MLSALRTISLYTVDANKVDSYILSSVKMYRMVLRVLRAKKETRYKDDNGIRM